MRDPYSILGVSKNADQKEIKAAWRATAKSLHPDQNPDDPKAVGRFTEAGRAYDLLKDPNKRRLFDEARARAAASGRSGKEATFMEQRAERARAEAEAKAAAAARAAALARAAAAAAAVDAENNASTAKTRDNGEEVVSKIFGSDKRESESAQAAPSPPEPPRAQKTEEQTYSAHERPSEKASEPSQPQAQAQAQPQSQVQPQSQAQTSPARELVSYLLKRLTRQGPTPEKAPDLNVDAMVSIEDILKRLNPAVTLPEDKLLSIPLPDSIQDGTQIRVEGYGHRLPGLKRGDVVATIRIKPHKWYRVDGHDLKTMVDVDIDRAVLGGEITVETPDGSHKITIPPWSGSQYSARIANRGLPKGSGNRGDLIAEVRVMLWDRPDQKLVDLIRSLKDGLYL
jgi:DnaJ-class molecular chaperone